MKPFYFICSLLFTFHLIADPTGYVTNNGNNTVTPIDLLTNTPGNPIGISFNNLIGIAVTPNGLLALAVNNQANTVSPIDLATNTVLEPITGAFNFPYFVTITPNGQTAYVVNQGDNNIIPIDVPTLTAGAPITGFTGPIICAVTPDGTRCYVTDFGAALVTPIDVATNTTLPDILVSGNPFGIVITPDGLTAYVGLGASVQAIDLTTQTAGTNISGDFNTVRTLAITPDGSTVYAVNLNGNNVTPIDTASNTALSAINSPFFNEPLDIAITPNGSTAYITNLSAGICILDIGSSTVSNLPANGTQYLAITTDGTTVYVTNEQDYIFRIITATNTFGTPIYGSFAQPVAVTFNHNGTFVYVVNELSNTITVINTATNTITDQFAGSFSGPNAIGVFGNFAYVNNEGGMSVTPINLLTNTALTPIALGGFTITMAVNPVLPLAYFASFGSIIPFDLTTQTPLASILGPFSFPTAIAFTPDGKTAYVVDEAGSTVTPINVVTSAVGTPITGPFSVPNAIAITPDGTTAYVTNLGSSSVIPIDLTTNIPGAPVVGVFVDPNAIAISSDGTTAYVVSPATNAVIPIDLATNIAGTPITANFFNPFAIALPPTIKAPILLRGKKLKDKFLNQLDLINQLSWNNPPKGGLAPLYYNIYRDSLTNLIGVVSAGLYPLVFEDHNRQAGVVYTYYVVSVDGAGNFSTPVSISL